eukprot:363453-Chlamydomonas_euryale.AAC.11
MRHQQHVRRRKRPIRAPNTRRRSPTCLGGRQVRPQGPADSGCHADPGAKHQRAASQQGWDRRLSLAVRLLSLPLTAWCAASVPGLCAGPHDTNVFRYKYRRITVLVCYKYRRISLPFRCQNIPNYF